MRLEIPDEDGELLRELLASVISDLSPEIANTDNAEFRHRLQRRRERLQAVLSAMETPEGRT